MKDFIAQNREYFFKTAILTKSFARYSNGPVEYLIKKGIRVDIKYNDHPLDEFITAGLIGDADAAIISAQDKIGSLVYKRCKNLKVIVNHAAGFDNIDLVEADRHGIKFFTCPVNHIAVAELTWALILACSRHLVRANRFVMEGGWNAPMFRGMEVTGKTLGIIGFGRIGKEVAIRSASFKNRVLIYDPYVSIPGSYEDINVEQTNLDKLLKESDIITLHIPLNSSTKRIINKEAFGSMKKTAILINTSRGGLIDENELFNALKNGDIMAAGLDVLTIEPPDISKLPNLDNLMILPHIGAQTNEANIKMSEMAADIVVKILTCENGQ